MCKLNRQGNDLLVMSNTDLKLTFIALFNVTEVANKKEFSQTCMRIQVF